MIENFGYKELYPIQNKWMMKNLQPSLMGVEVKFKKQTLKTRKLKKFIKLSHFIQ